LTASAGQEEEVIVDIETFIAMNHSNITFASEYPYHADIIFDVRLAFLYEHKAFKEDEIAKLEKEHTEQYLATLPKADSIWELLPGVAILFNALFMGISMDTYPDHGIWKFTEFCFSMIFLVEFIVRWKTLGLSNKADRCWNAFDFTCIVFSIFDLAMTHAASMMVDESDDVVNVEGLQLLKMLRLARLARLVRLLRFRAFQELKLMVEGVFSGIRVLAWAIVLLALCIFFWHVPGE